MAKIHLTDRTLSDIEEIYKYSVENWGKNTAEKYLDHLQDTLIFISNNPKILKVKPEVSIRFRAYQVKSHWLICEILNNDIYVLTVKHISIDLIHRLTTIEPSLEEESKLLFAQLKKKKSS